LFFDSLSTLAYDDDTSNDTRRADLALEFVMAKARTKGRKPYPDFPLFQHPNGQWSKKIRGRHYYFGVDPDAALSKYLTVRDDLQAGREPRVSSTGKTLGGICNAFLTRVTERQQSGEVAARTFRDYYEICEQLVKHLGRNADPERLRPEDFASFRAAIAKKYAPTRLNKHIIVTRMVFKWAFESELIDKPPRFGPDFKGASKRAVRQHKSENGKKLFGRDELLQILDAADPTLKAATLLGINGGLGNADIAQLKLSQIDLPGLLVDYPRPKTGVDRRIPLWPETAAAIRIVISNRPQPAPGSENLLFLTSRGSPLLAVWESGTRTDQVTMRFRNLLKSLGLHRVGKGFYWLRHTFQTVGDEARDPLATSAIMGHADASIAGHYREEISLERLRRVVDHVHGWLFGE